MTGLELTSVTHCGGNCDQVNERKRAAGRLVGWSRRPCDVPRSDHAAQHSDDTQSAPGSTRDMAGRPTTAQPEATCDVADAPTTPASPATTIHRRRRPTRSCRRRRWHSGRAGPGPHTDTSRARCTPRSRPARPDTRPTDSPPRRTAPGSRRSELASSSTPTASETSWTCAACGAAATLAVSSAAATRRDLVRWPTVEAPGTRSRAKTSAVSESYRPDDSWTWVWSDRSAQTPRTEHSARRRRSARNGRTRHCELELRQPVPDLPTPCLVGRRRRDYSSARVVPVSRWYNGRTVIGRRQSQDVDSWTDSRTSGRRKTTMTSDWCRRCCGHAL